MSTYAGHCIVLYIIVLLSLSSYTNGLQCGDTAIGSTTNITNTVNYTFTINETINNGLYVTFDSCRSKYDTYLYLYDDYGNTLDSCDDCGGCGLRTVLKPNILYNGQYILTVGGCCNKNNGDYGTYSVKILCNETSHPLEQGPYSDNWWINTTSTSPTTTETTATS